MKKKIIKVVVAIVLLVVVAVAVLLTYVKTQLPNVGPPTELKVEITPEKVARGKYLAHHVTVCMDCHSKRDWSKYSGPIDSTMLGTGGEVFDQNMGFPGVFYSKNITPYALASWTDGELYRAITTGVNKDGKALFPVMPYHNYGVMDPQDIECIIAYIRSIPSLKSTVAESVPDFPMNFIINTIPKPASPSKMPAKTDVLAYGKYIVNAAACAECHTKQEKGKKLAGMDFAGGFEFKMPSGMVRSPNITPDVTGIKGWTKEMFVQRFKMYADSSYKPVSLKPTDFNSPMPWTMYAGMTTEDLEAMYVYLQSVKPISNTVERFTPNK